MAAKKTISSRSMQLLKPFLKANFEAGWEIEIMSFLYKHNEQIWTYKQLEENFQIEPVKLKATLTRLCQNGLVQANQESSSFRYSPDTSEKSALMNLLAKAYSQKKLQLIRIVYE